MDDEAVRFIWEHVRLFLRGDAGRGFDVGKSTSFEALLAFVGARGREQLACWAEEERRLVTAMCLLGPDADDIPPAAIRDHLAEIARRFEPSPTKRLDRVMEFAIAFGCGWQRQLQPEGNAWERRWADAVRALSRALEPAVAQARLWLTHHVVHYPRTKENDLSDAHVLTMRLLHPLHLEQGDALSITYREPDALVAPTRREPTSVPPGAKYVLSAIDKTRLVGPHKAVSIDADTTLILTVHDTEARIAVHEAGQRLQLQAGQSANTVGPTTLLTWACTCGNQQCAQRHRLAVWNAPLRSLWAFVASAVKGLPQLRTNAFIQGMYFPLLAYEGGGGARLRLVHVEYKVCVAEVGAGVCAEEYEGDQCTSCGTPPHVCTKRRTHPRLVCVDTDLPIYEREERLRCTNRACQNVYPLPHEWAAWEQVRKAKEWQRYPERLPDAVRVHPVDVQRLQQAIETRLASLKCPICAAQAPRRATTVWVRRFVRRAEQDVDHLRGVSVRCIQDGEE